MNFEDKLPYGWEIYDSENTFEGDYFIVFIPGKSFKGLENFDLSVRFEDEGASQGYYLIEYNEDDYNENKLHGPWDGSEREIISVLKKASKLSKKWSKGEELSPPKKRRWVPSARNWRAPEEDEANNFDEYDEYL